MANELTVCLFNPDDSGRPDFSAPFRDVPGLRVHCEPTRWEDLRDWLRHTHLDVVVINLDDPRGESISVAERVAQQSPKSGIVGVSSQTDPNFIIKAMRAGCSQFVCWPIDAADLRSAMERIRSQHPLELIGSRRVCVIGASGGTGATMIACNLAAELGQLAGRRAGLIDLNLEFGDVACAFDCQPAYSVADVCGEGMEMDSSVVEKALHLLSCDVALLARPEKLEHARTVMPDSVEHMLHLMGELFPFVVVDLPRVYNFLSMAALRTADLVLIITQLGVPFIRNAARLYQCIADMGANEQNIQIVLNRCKASFERITPKEVEEHFQRPVFATIPNDYKRVQGALDLGHPVVAEGQSGPARMAIREMARKIVEMSGGKIEGRVPGAPGSQGFFGRLLGRGAK